MVISSTAPVTSATIGSLSLPVPNVCRLATPVPPLPIAAEALTPNSTSFFVNNCTNLQLPGLIYVGSEIMRAQLIAGTNGTQMLIVAQAGDPPPGNGRGLHGSSPIAHMVGEPVSDGAGILFARFITASGITSAATPMLVFRPDPASPTTPGTPQPLESGQPTYDVRWAPATEGNAGVVEYEVQERGGAATDLSANVVWRTLNIMTAPAVGQQGNYGVGFPNLFAGEEPRPAGNFYSYRVRAISGSGVLSAWSLASASVNTGITSQVITGVENFPNPFDTRLGGPSGQTQITYTLGADADVTITIYDLLGYVVRRFSLGSGTPGGMAGPNFVMWDGKNGSGAYVSKGGYIAAIKVKSSLGTTTVDRKIGVIH